MPGDLLLPVPALIIQGASEGVITGSFIVFGLLFLSSLLLGRAFCGWVCPAGGGQEACFAIRGKRAPGGRLNWIKYFIWAPWLGLIVAMFLKAGGVKKVDPSTRPGTASPPRNAGRYRAGGRVGGDPRHRAGDGEAGLLPLRLLDGLLHDHRPQAATRVCWKSLQLVPEHAKCTDCKKCEKACPMSLEVNAMVAGENMENNECILCGCASTNIVPGRLSSYPLRRCANRSRRCSAARRLRR